jgi:hypothetical protein
MSENRISIAFTEAEISDINTAIQTLQSKLFPKLIALTKEDKQSVPKIKEKAVPFMEKSLQYMETNPEFIPPYFDKAEVNKDFDGFRTMTNFLRLLAPTISNTEDTAFLCGSESYQGALNYYNSAKQAAKMNVPNAKAIYEDLSIYFDAQKVKPLKPSDSKE